MSDKVYNSNKFEDLIDCFDDNYNYLGSKPSEEIHRQGIWHHNFHCWIIKPESKKVIGILISDSHVLLSQKMDVSIYGQPLAGEDILKGKREVEKILGYNIKEKSLIKIGIEKEISFIEQFDVDHKVFSHSYFIKEESILTEHINKLKHVDSLFEMDISDALDLFSDKKSSIFIDLISYDGKRKNKEVSYADFAQRGKKYLHRVLFMINEWLEMDEWEKKYNKKYPEGIEREQK